MKKSLLFLMMLLCTVASKAVTITEVGGWFESGYVTWTGTKQNYTVYVKGGQYADFTALDKELVRKYADYYRADAVGLKAGTYQFKIVGADNSETTTESFTATAHDRSGFAHVGMLNGIGAYKNDGTLKDGARVIYVTAKTAKTVKCNVMTDADTEYTGLQAILAAFEKGKETRPLAIRIIGTIKKADMDSFGSSAEGLQVKGKNGSTDMNITIEGIGNDANIHGFGFLIRNACSVELRNFANMICMDDCVSLDTDNHHVWVHNMDFFYGGTGGDSDQAKGDGTVDIKGKSSHITISYNHFYDSGKCSLGGMKGETTDCWMTYHHNWFDHSDSRHPRIRTAFYHVYNNYFDGNSKYGVGVTSGGSSFVEANYFRNVKYPMLASKQGTDAEGDGTFSGENGGVNKAYNNVIINPRKVQYWSEEVQATGEWDAVLVENRADAVTATAFTGGTGYNSKADQAARTQYIENKMDDPEDIPAIVKSNLGAGRLQHGDFKWTFNNSLQDENYDVIQDLKSALVSYESTVVSFADGTAISSRTPATETVDSGDGKGIDEETNNAYVPTWAGGSGSTVVAAGKQVIGENDDWFWFNVDNQAKVNEYMLDGGETAPSTIMTNGTFNPSRTITNSKSGSCSDYTGSILLPASSYLTMYYANGISTIAFYVSGNGSQKWVVEKSANGTSWKDVSTVEGNTGAHPAVVASFEESEGIKYVRVTNKASGGRDIQGVKVYTPTGASDLAIVDGKADIALNIGGTYTITQNTDFSTSGTGAISYKSSATKVATVDASTGIITAVAEGTAKITLTQAADDSHNSSTITFNVTVSDGRSASQLALTSDAEVTIEKGNTSNIIVSYNVGALTYSSDATSIATVSETGVITAVGYGTTTITVSDAGDASTKPGKVTVKVTVPDNRTESILAVESEDITVNRNETKQINVTAYTGSVTYRSADETIATVDENGVVTGVLAGETSIVVSDPGNESVLPGTVSVDITVIDNRAESQLEITSGTIVDIDMAVSKTSAITANGTSGALTYDVDDESIISVSAEGVITAIKGGTTTVTVMDAGNDNYKPGSKTITVNVTAIPPADPVTWATGDASTLKDGTSISNGGKAVFISTDETALELIYYGGSSCKIDSKNDISYIKMGGATQYKDNALSTRYFELPPLSGSGTLTVSYAATAAGIKITATKDKDATAIATITQTATSVRLENLNDQVLYMSVPSGKAYITGVTWTPDLDTKTASTFAITSDREIAIEVNGTSQITYENNAGSVTFSSDNTAAATVNTDGVITGVADGTANITVKDAGSETVKGKTFTISVTVGNGGQGGGGDEPVTGGEVTLEYGNIPNGYAIDGSTNITLFDYNNDWKVQNLFNVAVGEHTISIPNGVTVTKIVMYGVSADNNPATLTSLAGTTLNVSLPGRKSTTTPATATVDNLSITDSFKFTITTKKAAVKFALTVKSATGISTINAETLKADGIIYDLMGRKVMQPVRGQLYIQNGRKFIYR